MLIDSACDLLCPTTIEYRRERGYYRGGKTLGDDKTNDHDMGCKGKYTRFGVVNEDT